MPVTKSCRVVGDTGYVEIRAGDDGKVFVSVQDGNADGEAIVLATEITQALTEVTGV